MENLIANREAWRGFASGTVSKIGNVEFEKLWAKLIAAYPRHETNALTVEVYYERLCGFPMDKLADAVGACLDELKYFPAITEIIERVKVPRRCLHADVMARLEVRERIIEQKEKDIARRLEAAAKTIADSQAKIAELKAKSQALFEAERKYIEAAKLPEARAKLADLNKEIEDKQKQLANMGRRLVLAGQAKEIKDNEGVCNAGQASA